MEQLYNPDLMSEPEIKATFVARQPLLDKLVTTVERQPNGAGVQHVVVIAPRGMGKTTLLIMLQLALTDKGLAPPWLPIRFPEELYGVNDLADFWLEVLERVSQAAPDADLARQTQQIRDQYSAGDHLAEGALALIKDWCRSHGRRLVLLTDNFNLLLAALSEQENAELRRTLMNEGFLMIVGAAPTFFQEASDYEFPLYNFFRTEQLSPLNSSEIDALLSSRAAADGIEGYNIALQNNASRLRVLEYFTGGNPRLVLMLYRVIARSEVIEVKEGLERLLDEVTPYYKHKMECLPPQQRKILDTIARITGETHEGVTPGELARTTRLSPTAVSSQLKRLSEQGYVRSANLRGRNAYYTLSEQLFTLWYQMRLGRTARERMGWLVDFLKAYYDFKELVDPGNEIHDLLQTAIAGHVDLVRQRISESPRADSLFPLDRAIDCLGPNGQTLLEKLTPDMSPIVGELVAKLRVNRNGAVLSSGGTPPRRRSRTRRVGGVAAKFR
ncbi:MAG: AAA family ATPase [Capsulimonadaceae bacterium]